MKIRLENGQEYRGESFGYPKNAIGEVVFNTLMCGYVEALTDPSYHGQILLLTYPLQGNYGVPDSLFESRRIQVSGLLIANHALYPAHFKHAHTLQEWLYSQKIPALHQVNTRALTQYLREKSTMKGLLVSQEGEYPQAAEVDTIIYSEEECVFHSGDLKVLVIDIGCKRNIIRSLCCRGVTVICIPWWKDWEQYIPECNGVVISNGPGNPNQYVELITRVKGLITLDMPIFGICLGHQLLSLAAGAVIEKMAYGHRSVNQPVRDERTRKCYITSQNHGYMVVKETLPEDWMPWFTNLNDYSNEGMYHKYKPIRSVQFHPEASPGPNDTAFLFDEFVYDMNAYGRTISVSSKYKAIENQVYDLEIRK